MKQMDIHYGLYFCTPKEATEISCRTCEWCEEQITYAKKHKLNVVVARKDWHAIGVIGKKGKLREAPSKIS